MNFLRPVYTEFLFKQLQKQSLNVYGADGQGQERLLQDLQKKAKAAGIVVLLANMKDYAQKYESFIKALTTQLAKQLAVNEEGLSLEKLLDTHAQQKTVWILLNQFDAVLDRAELDNQYGIAFFDQLNALKNRGYCFLLCVTEKPYQHYHLYAEKIHRLSRLDLELDELTKLSRQECEQELQRRQLNLLNEHFNLLLQTVYEHSQPYDFLDYVCKRIEAGDMKTKLFKERLAVWQQNFKKQNSATFLHKVESVQNKVKIVIQWLNSLSLTMKALAAAVAMFALSATPLFKPVVNFILELVNKIWH